MVLDPDSGQYDPHPSLEQMASALAFLTERVAHLEREHETVPVRLQYLYEELERIKAAWRSAKRPPSRSDDTAEQ
jgi:hypothetical protein